MTAWLPRLPARLPTGRYPVLTFPTPQRTVNDQLDAAVPRFRPGWCAVKKGSPSSGRARQPYDLESLLAVVVDVFNELGYDGTSMEDLSRRLGISKSAIYHHVEGKEELLRIALDRAL